jgi:hypothetical protein
MKRRAFLTSLLALPAAATSIRILERAPQGERSERLHHRFGLPLALRFFAPDGRQIFEGPAVYGEDGYATGTWSNVPTGTVIASGAFWFGPKRVECPSDGYFPVHGNGGDVSMVQKIELL